MIHVSNADTSCEAEWMARFDALQSSGAGFEAAWQACLAGAIGLMCSSIGYAETAAHLQDLGDDSSRISFFLTDRPVPPRSELATRPSDENLHQSIAEAFVGELQPRFGTERAVNALLNVALSLGVAHYGVEEMESRLKDAAEKHRQMGAAGFDSQMTKQ